ncbi:hypothetical protein BCR33DRAFT_719008 [Rhizoclosmatium globosum]|uniref:Uncharacterized protein n=1 Tax=Rhizoclosmatium globosum TaxID=329046 RepID=A0A1Y2C383_9FUNG|nr:hypothetical protein BCR33DRAFT_719008 [Rhizoclosmatium globosum]|eukprot:ORY41406.1 hypothetical protein BCR33DRAFT_719008 [Rhizoclosmatium globosum]
MLLALSLSGVRILIFHTAIRHTGQVLNYITKSISPVYCSGAWESGPGKDPASGALFASVTNTIDQPTFQKVGLIQVFAAFPLLTMAYIFEVAKLEEFYSDFRIANDTAVLAAFKQVVASVDSAGYMSWANRSTFVKPVSSSIATAAPTQTKSNGFQAIFDTVVSFLLPFLV